MTDNLDLTEALSGLNIGTESNESIQNKLEVEASKCGIKLATTNKEPEQAHKIFYGLTEDNRKVAVDAAIIPRNYKDVRFDEELIKSNLKKQYKRNKIYKIHKFNDYITLCNGILSAIRMKKLPDRSYLIGAPNGFGKSSFVNECLITLKAHGFRVAPYISLWELDQIRVENEIRRMSPYKKYKEETQQGDYYYIEPNVSKGYMKTPEVVTGQYSYSEYINADCLFVFFTDVKSKDIESHALYQLLSIRGAKGLPTIVMMSTSLEPYENDRELKEQVWDEIITFDDKKYNYDRVYHVSCYKMKSLALDNKGEEVDSDTGIIN